MAVSKIFLITGAGRGMGVDLVQAALSAGHSVVATGRNAARVRESLGDHDQLLTTDLDITDPASITAAVDVALARFGRIDVLLNNAGNFYAGFFEELSPAQVDQQIQTNLVGPMHVTRAVLPVMRSQRSGHVVTISSMAGLVGQEFCSAYAASKFGLEGWMESIRTEIEPFGIRTTIVEPGFFRTDLLEETSTTWAELSIDDYAERTAQTITAWKSMNGQQGGDPAKLATALVGLIDSDEPPFRWVAGADAVPGAEQVAHDLLAQVDAHRELSESLSFETADAVS